MLLDIPKFIPKYDQNVEYGYKNKPGENLEKLLRDTSKNHCMYCYALLKNDRVNIGHMEHGIEKSLAEQNLTECVPNIALACPNCNQSLKRVGERERLQQLEKERDEFIANVQCAGKNCKIECEHLKRLKREYCRKSKIILQPFGVVGDKSQQEYRIQYDVYNAQFIPSKEYSYNENDVEYILSHINRFRLNDPEFKTRALADFIEDVIETDGKYREKSEYANYIVDLFKEKIKGLGQEKVLKLCKQLYIKNFMLFRN